MEATLSIFHETNRDTICKGIKVYLLYKREIFERGQKCWRIYVVSGLVRKTQKRDEQQLVMNKLKKNGFHFGNWPSKYVVVVVVTCHRNWKSSASASASADTCTHACILGQLGLC